MRPFRPIFTVRTLMLAVAVAASSSAWSGRWSDFKHRAALHAGQAFQERWVARSAGMTREAVDLQGRKAEWHDEMRRRYEVAAWIPWPYPPAEPPRPD